jgi:hypothetical protein
LQNNYRYSEKFRIRKPLRKADAPDVVSDTKGETMRKLLFVTSGIVGLVLAMLPTQTFATTLLPPGNCIGTCAASLGTIDFLTFSGPVLATAGPVSFTGTNALGQTKFTGKVQEEVIQDVGGLLDFVYQFEDLTIDAITSMAVTDYTGFVTNVGTNTSNLFLPPGGTDVPADISRSSSGDTITFDFAPNTPSGVGNGVETLELVVKTNATSFGPGSINFIGGGIASVAGLAPTVVTPTPEPSSAALLASGLLAGALIGFRRRKLHAKN